MAKRKSATIEQEARLRETEALSQEKRRATRRRGEEDTVPTQAVRRTAASVVVPQPTKGRRSASTPEHVPTVAELALRYPSIAAFPGLAMSAAAAPLPAHTSLQPQHTHGKLSVRQCLSELRGALAEGWEIVQPIFARPLWSVTDDSITAFNFVLRRELATRLVVVPEGRTVERLIHDLDLTVDYRR